MVFKLFAFVFGVSLGVALSFVVPDGLPVSLVVALGVTVVILSLRKRYA
jgi:hypothetical protein